MGNPVKLKANVIEVVEHGAGVYTVKMETEGRMPKFRPGQFLHLAVDDYNPSGGFWPESRVFSIASLDEGAFITIAYSVKGLYTARMASCLRPGKEVWLKLPYGDFVVGSKDGQDHDVVLVAGGTGISPFIPFLQGLEGRQVRGQRFRLYYGARNPKHLLFLDLLERCAEKRLVDIDVLLEEGVESARLNKTLAVRKGMLNIDFIAEECRDLTEPDFYLSGPPAMIDTFRSRLFARGIHKENVRIDEWE